MESNLDLLGSICSGIVIRHQCKGIESSLASWLPAPWISFRTQSKIKEPWPWLPALMFILGFLLEPKAKSPNSGPGFLHSVSPLLSITIHARINELWPWVPALCFSFDFH